MKIWQKLTLAFGGTSFLLGTIAILSIKIDSEVQSQTNQTVHGIVEEAKAATTIFNSIQIVQKLNQDLLFENLADSRDRELFQQEQRQIKLELEKLEKSIIAAKQATIDQKLIIKSSDTIEFSSKKSQIARENNEVAEMNQLLVEIDNYKRDWDFFLEKLEQNSEEIPLAEANQLRDRIDRVIFPLIKDYYEESLSEIAESELLTQKLTSQNITIIKNYVLFTFVVTAILFIYIYRSIYMPIKQLKLATFQLGKNFSEYKPIQPINPNDELGGLIKYFNHTIERLQTKIISKSYLDNIVNSIAQSLIVINNENKIDKVNYNTIEILGYSESELIGQPIERILAPSNALKIDELIKLDDLSSRCFTLDLITKKSEKISLTVYFSYLFDSDGNKKGTICLAMPIENLSLSDIMALQQSKEKAKKNIQ